MKKILVLTCLIMFAASCYYDKEEELYGLVPCDTSTVRYKVEITAILNANCLSCHGGTASSGGGVQLGNYNILRDYALGGLLVEAITRSNNRMPKGAAPLTNCQIAQIEKWINNGAPNN